MRKTFIKRLASVFLCVCLCFSALSVGSMAAARDTSYVETLAQDLKELGLFKGISDTDFGLNRAPTRVEAIVMLIRVLGKENVAVNGSWSHPFTDVPGWATNYVGYAYQNGLTKGMSDTSFGTSNANAQMYLTFILRALGYSDANGLDFTYSDPFTLSKSIGILPDFVNVSDFWRADVVIVSYAALAVKLKGSSQTLSQKLISDGVFSRETYDIIYDSKAIANYPKTSDAKVELDAEQIYAKCSPAVFYIEVANKEGKVYASGSGFFILSDGTAVTNYHVIDGAYSAKITLSSTKEQYNVAGVYDYDKDEDWAIIKIDGSKFPYLDIADPSTVVGGAKCYAIGSPKGLQNTISDEIISNPSQVLGGKSYIQTSAAISRGSSGGALINKFGQVIGITSAVYEDGENLGFAIPISKIEGYSHNKYTALSVLFPGTSPNKTPSALDAYNNLAAFVQEYYNYSTTNRLEYSVTYNTENGYITYRLFYFTDDYNLGISRQESYKGTMYYTYVFFTPESLYQYVGYTIYTDIYSSEPIFSAYSWVYSPSFYGNNLSFDNISINAGLDIDDIELVASSDLQDALYFTDYIFYSYLSEFGPLGVYLFGFKDYSLY